MRSARPWRRAVAALALVALGGCSRPAPLRIGFVAELSGRSADLGEAGRNGFMLAVDDSRAALGGRAVEVLVRDVGGGPDAARQAVGELIAARVEVIVGPMVSATVDLIQPAAEAAGVVLLSPTVSASKFYGLDDVLFRINGTTRDTGRNYAERLYRRGLKRVAVAASQNNRAFSESWLAAFRGAYEALGGSIVAAPYFDSGAASHDDVVRALLKGRPEGVLLIGSAVDSARIAQQVRKQAPTMPMVASEWAGTAQLIELGGRAVEGMMLVQNFRIEDDSPRFSSFRDAHVRRFGKPPTFGSVLSYDAGLVVMDVLARRPDGMGMKDALRSLGPYRGLQQAVSFDANGDATRGAYFVTVRDGHFVAE